MRNKLLIGMLIGSAIGGYGDLAMAKKGGKGKKSFCDGQMANVIGTNKSDVIVVNDDNTATVNGALVTFGDPGDSVQAVVSGGNGSDVITGSVHDDILCGGNGKDIISGKDGNDRIFGQNGKDELYGDDADGTCVAVDPAGPNGIPGDDDDVEPNCNDYIEGGNGKDLIAGGDGDDALEGGNGRDVIEGGPGSDVINGGRGKDECAYADSGDFDDADEEADSEDNECEI
ncbi:MAG: calcium-binding protein [Gammaproteobacteria bacterium]